MVTFVFSPWGIPADFRQFTILGYAYKLVNKEGEVVLVKYHWEPVPEAVKHAEEKGSF